MNRQEATWLRQIQSRRDEIPPGRVLVACSGGGDSVALLVFLWSIRRSLQLDLCVAHAHHGLREEAEGDAVLVRGLCRDLNLDLAEAQLNVKEHADREGLGLEMAARDLRWDWLKSEARSCGATLIATGHTLDDHTETVLIRLARGGGLGSLTPLPPRQAMRWSPLIEARREDLRAYLRNKGLPWREDASNQDPFTPRNRWRALLPEIRKEAPALDQHLLETHTQVRELLAYRDTQVASWHGSRWSLVKAPSPAIRWQGPWSLPELHWVLEAAFRQLGWAREAQHLRDLAAWLLPNLNRRPGKPKTWGSWSLNPETSGWILHPRNTGLG
ncbi:MAG: tRNA(Ile)-lysidine synthase [Holophagaceae bacterium]|nr:tRNA(Ile)-lysidine synthase [Holophagaceae bacterium]